MHYTLIIEAVFVGFYLLFWFLLVSSFVNNFYSVLFISGFLKHFFGYYLGIQDYYYRHGVACQVYRQEIPNTLSERKERRVKNDPLQLFGESILEGFAVLIMGYFLSLGIPNKLTMVFFTGVGLHGIAEIVGIHRDFCER
jgi:hypothetical protein